MDRMLSIRKTFHIGWELLVVLLIGAISAAAIANPPDAIRPCRDAKNKKDDVYCIGKRNIQYKTFVSIQKAEEIGKEYAERIDRSSHILKNPYVVDFVNKVEQNIAENSDSKYPMTVGVIESPQVNAFTLPGGYIFVYTGLIQAASSQAELAAVLCHETAHAAMRNPSANITRKDLLQYLTLPLIFTPMSYPLYLGVSEGLNFGIPMAWLKYRRGEERHADFYGMQYLWKSGYWPYAFIGMFAKIERMRQSMPGSVPGILENHPVTPDRIIWLEKEIKNMLPPRKHYLVSTSQFQLVRERLNNILKAQDRLRIAGNKNRPTLRRREPRTSPVNRSIKNSGNDKPPILGKPPGRSAGGKSAGS